MGCRTVSFGGTVSGRGQATGGSGKARDCLWDLRGSAGVRGVAVVLIGVAPQFAARSAPAGQGPFTSSGRAGMRTGKRLWPSMCVANLIVTGGVL